ncbi:hypothetical protein FRB90_002192 [Tulasnella sp. 427]|nr:hypothetical protein FRB90_002192 [Tulasnella sp. 427]
MLRDPGERLRRAIKENNLYLVRRIIERNTDTKEPGVRRQRQIHRFDIRNPDPGPGRYTSLAWAAVNGHEEIFEYLLTLGHDEEELSRDAENNTILILLAGVKNSPILNAQGREYDIQDIALRMARMYYERYPYLIDWSNVHGKTALHVAATKGNEGFVRETARAQFENNKRARRHIFAQAAARAGERAVREGYPHDDPRKGIKLTKEELNRLRSGSSGSRTTTSDADGSTSQHPSPPVPPPKGPAAPSAASQPTPSSSSGSIPIRPSPSVNGSTSLNTGSPGAPLGISPVASRMRERDADAMAEYMKRTRSGSNGTSNGGNGDHRSNPPVMAKSSTMPVSGSTTPTPSTINARSPALASRLLSDREAPLPDLPSSSRTLDSSSDTTARAPVRRLRPSNSAASLRPTGIIGMPPGASAHGHSNSVIEFDVLSQALNPATPSPREYKSFLPQLSPVGSPPSSPLPLEETRPLNIKPKSRPTLGESQSTGSLVVIPDQNGLAETPRAQSAVPMMQSLSGDGRSPVGPLLNGSFVVGGKMSGSSARRAQETR